MGNITVTITEDCYRIMTKGRKSLPYSIPFTKLSL